MGNVDKAVELYIKLRDRETEIRQRHADELGAIKALKAKIEAAIQAELSRVGGDSIKTPHGTAYRTTKRSPSIADWEAFQSYVRENDAWDMVERRCAKSAVLDYLDETGKLPPGVKLYSEVSINVRR